MRDVTPQLARNRSLAVLTDAIDDADREILLETRNRLGQRRDWLDGHCFEVGLRRLAEALLILWDGAVREGALITDG